MSTKSNPELKNKTERKAVLKRALQKYEAAYKLAVKQKNVGHMLTAANLMERVEREIVSI